ncbi:MAG: hypothetical protein KF773_23830 [Deltaproteobacteria bacterium]|nr:hypothetical protein [Deltaproteobacteria bacterium]
MDRRHQLRAWIVETEQLQRRLIAVFAALALAGFWVMAYSARAGVLALAGTTFAAVTSYWVTAAHNAAHRQKLEELRHTDR